MKFLVCTLLLSSAVFAKESPKPKRGLGFLGDHNALTFNHDHLTSYNNLEELHNDHHGEITHITLHKKVPVPVPHPVAVPILKKIPVPVKVPVPFKVDKPYAVHVAQPYPVHIDKPYPVKIEKTVPVPVKVAVPFTNAVPEYNSFKGLGDYQNELSFDDEHVSLEGRHSVSYGNNNGHYYSINHSIN